MPVNVKEYLNSMKQTSSRQSVTTSSTSLKNQALLSQLIEALAYANSIDFRQKTLNAAAPNSSSSGRDILNNIKAQESLIKQLTDGQKLSSEQNKKLTEAIDKFYELTNAQEVNYKKFADQLERFAMQDLPDAVKNRLINDSRDAHIIGTDQKNKDGIILPIIKKIKYLLEDSAEATKQFGKKFFVTLDEFKEGILGAFGELGEAIADGSFMSQMLEFVKGLGMGFLALQGMFKEGMFAPGQITKWISRAFMPGVQKGITKVIGGAFGGILKGLGSLMGKFGLKGASTGLKMAGRAGAKFLKKIPLLGTIISVWMGIERWKQKDYLGALIEFGSGIAACFPGVGTIVSVLLDLLNLGLDTIGKDFKGEANKKLSKLDLKEDALLSIPVVGPIIGMSKAFKAWKSGDKKGALEFAAKSFAAIIPGGTLIVDLLMSLFDIDASDIDTSGSSNKKSGFKWPWQKGNSENQSGGQFGSAGSASFGANLATAATSISGHNTKSQGICARRVGDALERVIGKEANNYRGNAWQWESKLDKSKYFNRAGIATSNKDLQNLPAGSIALWRKQKAHPYGHIEIADGRGRLISDFVRKATLGLYRSNPAGIKPIIYTPKDVKVPQLASIENTQGQTETSSSGDSFSGTSELEAQPSMSFDDMMAQFNKFNQDIIAGANTQGDSQSLNNFANYNNSLTSGATTSKAPVQQQSVQYTSNNDSQQTMTKEIEDTDLALLNSILFS